MRKIITSILLLFVLTTNAFADHWRWSRYPRHNRYSYPRYNDNYHNYSRTGRLSPGAVTAIGLGVGVLGFAIGRSTKKTSESYNSKIECKEFDMKVMIDGEEKKAKVTKCRTQDGSWQIPD